MTAFNELAVAHGDDLVRQLQDKALARGDVGEDETNRYLLAADKVRKWSSSMQKELLHKSIFEYTTIANVGCPHQHNSSTT